MGKLRELKDNTKSAFFPLGGGLKLEDPPLTRKQGTLSDAINFECDPKGGYTRFRGYERYDGRLKPSEAAYWILDFLNASVALVDGMKVIGQTSGATAELIANAVVESGTYGGGDAAGYLVLGFVSGTFLNGETLSFIGPTDGFDWGFSSGFA